MKTWDEEMEELQRLRDKIRKGLIEDGIDPDKKLTFFDGEEGTNIISLSMALNPSLELEEEMPEEDTEEETPEEES